MLRVNPPLFHEICNAFGLLILFVQNVTLDETTLMTAFGVLLVFSFG